MVTMEDCVYLNEGKRMKLNMKDDKYLYGSVCRRNER